MTDPPDAYSARSSGSPRSCCRAWPAASAGLRVGDVLLAVDGQDVVSSTAVQQLMVEAAIGRPMEVTVWRNGALVDVVAVPRELTGAGE